MTAGTPANVRWSRMEDATTALPGVRSVVEQDTFRRAPMSKDPLDLERLATTLRRSIYNAYMATLVGDAPEVTKRYYKRASKPQIGDLVTEATTIGGMRHDNATDLDGVGILEDVTWEPVDFGDPDFVWDEAEEGRPHPTEQVFYIRTLDGRRFRWVNANFVAAVSEAHFSDSTR